MNPDFQKKLLAWFDQHKRALPFRASRAPYPVWLSEIMAQQTTMSAVIPYFEKFIKRFPTLEDVARAAPDELLTYWQGLGYYSRIRNFQKACQTVLAEWNGQLPRTASEWQTLPGIGPYTAAAIASICFDEPVAVVDGNVKRVLARLFWFEDDPDSSAGKTFFATKARALLDPKRPGDFNQAIMELGALVCRPKAPQCLLCPVSASCQAARRNPEAVPLRKKMALIDVTYHALIVTQNNAVLLKKPTPNNLIANMWELPSVYDSKEPLCIWQSCLEKNLTAQKIGTVRHGITNRKITVDVYKTQKPLTRFRKNDFEYVPLANLPALPVSTISKKILKKFGSGVV